MFLLLHVYVYELYVHTIMYDLWGSNTPFMYKDWN